MLGPRLRQVLDSYQGSIEPAPPTRPMDEPPQRPARTARFLMAMVATALLGVFCGATVVAFVRLAELWPQTQPAPSPADLVTAPSAAPSADSPLGIGDSQTPTSEEPTAASTEPTALALAPSAVPNVQMVLDGESVTVINISGDRLTLDGVAFKRVALDGAVTASFRAANWNRVAAYPVGQLPPGDCYQLRRLGTDLTWPPACDSLLGWLATANRDWFFWIAKEPGDVIRVFQRDVPVYTCRIGEERCVFDLPQG